MTHYEVLIAGVAATLASLLYIGRQLRGIAALITFIGTLPSEHRQLVAATAANTTAIAALTVQLAALTADVSALVHK